MRQYSLLATVGRPIVRNRRRVLDGRSRTDEVDKLALQTSLSRPDRDRTRRRAARHLLGLWGAGTTTTRLGYGAACASGVLGRAGNRLVTTQVPGEKGGYSVAEENEPVTGPRREKASGRKPNAADDIAILDYVMLDFIDEPFAPRENDQQGAVAKP